MDFRAIGMLQKAVPIILRHLDAYVELAEGDWRTAKQNAVHSMRLLAVMVGSGFFALLLCCGVVVALTWDGPYRVAAIASMAGLFAVALTVSGILYAKREREIFPSVRREWSRDRELVQELLSGDEHANTPPSNRQRETTSGFNPESSVASNRDHATPDDPVRPDDQTRKDHSEFRPSRANGASGRASSTA